jgi:hypothetical protein
MFSSRQALELAARQAMAPVGFAAMAGRSAFDLLAQQPQAAFLNPGLPYGKAFTPSEIQRLANGSFFEADQQIAIQRPTDVLLGQPAAYPQRLVDALIRKFSTTPTVRAAYLAQIHFPNGNEPPHPVVGLDSTNYAADVREAGAVAREAADTEGPIDFVQVSANASGAVETYLRDKATPFYRLARIT